MPGLPPEMVKLLGRLNTAPATARTFSTTRRAAASRRDGGRARGGLQIAKMGGLLHDIGKAIDHEVRGRTPRSAARSPAPNPDEGRERVAAHHEEVDFACVEAPIVQLADAISASRPGARSESMDTYSSGSRPSGDRRASRRRALFAVQAGREVRILVRPEEIDDMASMSSPATSSARSRRTLTSPGQIKVTVIPESRAVEYAELSFSASRSAAGRAAGGFGGRRVPVATASVSAGLTDHPAPRRRGHADERGRWRVAARTVLASERPRPPPGLRRSLATTADTEQLAEGAKEVEVATSSSARPWGERVIGWPSCIMLWPVHHLPRPGAEGHWRLEGEALLAAVPGWGWLCPSPATSPGRGQRRVWRSRDAEPTTGNAATSTVCATWPVAEGTDEVAP